MDLSQIFSILRYFLGLMSFLLEWWPVRWDAALQVCRKMKGILMDILLTRRGCYVSEKFDNDSITVKRAE